jgi:hypothetical protein
MSIFFGTGRNWVGRKHNSCAILSQKCKGGVGKQLEMVIRSRWGSTIKEAGKHSKKGDMNKA